MQIDCDDTLLATAQEIAPEHILKISCRTHPVQGTDWKVTDCAKNLEGWGETLNAALQRFIAHKFYLQVKDKMAQFWENDYSHEKFEALNKFMEDYDARKLIPIR